MNHTIDSFVISGYILVIDNSLMMTFANGWLMDSGSNNLVEFDSFRDAELWMLDNFELSKLDENTVDNCGFDMCLADSWPDDTYRV